MDLKAALIVALGSFVGGGSRYLVASFVDARASGEFPLSIFLVNLIGSFLIGFLTPMMTYYAWEKGSGIPLFLSAGLLGGFTTFSTFSLQTLRLAQSGSWGIAFVNAFASVACCLVSVFLGLKVGQAIFE